MSYNIRNARGADDRVDLVRIERVIASFRPDLVALQEVDAGRPRSGGEDQAAVLAARLGLTATYAVCIERGCERYGIATLARFPAVATRQLELPSLAHRRSEPRRALLTRFAWPVAGSTLALVNTHLSTLAAERRSQIAAIVEDLRDDDVVVAGDFNCTPWSRPLRRLRARLRSATRRARSWPARLPIVPIDHILYGGRLSVVEAGSWTEGGARHASDHLPVVAVLEAA